VSVTCNVTALRYAVTLQVSTLTDGDCWKEGDAVIEKRDFDISHMFSPDRRREYQGNLPMLYDSTACLE
jgi:hypothetical protein